MGWTKSEQQSLIDMVREGKHFYTEIAKTLRKTPGAVRWKAKTLGLPSSREFLKNRRFGEWNAKHSHLREDALTYFQTHTFEQTMRRFRLTHSELKSLMTAGYRCSRLKHLRKDKRRKDAWSAKELRFLLKASGLISRDEIAERLNRGSRLGIKDRLESLGVASRTVNGMTLSMYREMFGKEPKKLIETRAGPGRTGLPTFFKIVTWDQLEREVRAKTITPTPTFRLLIETMAMFQRWVHGRSVSRSIRKILSD